MHRHVSGVSFRLFAKVFTSLSRTKRAAHFSSTSIWNTSVIWRSFEYLQVKSDAKALCEVLGFQLQLNGCKLEVMIAFNVSNWERPCICFVDARLEAFGCQDEVYLVVNLPIRRIPGCCHRQLVGVESVGKGESVALCKL